MRRFMITYYDGNVLKVADFQSDTELRFVAGEVYYLCAQHLEALPEHTREWEIQSIIEIPEHTKYDTEQYLEGLEHGIGAIMLLDAA